MNAGTLVKQGSPAGPCDAGENPSLHRVLAELYREQLALDPKNYYLLEHGHPTCIANQVRTFEWYRSYLPARGHILDWGCRQAPDSCLIRAAYGDRVTLSACDFMDASEFQVFHDYAQCDYRRLDDDVQLPFASNTFDAVIASGVLEHAARDYESLKELYRVLKPEGLLIVSYLPNWLSIAEWRRRNFSKKRFHRRLYGIGEARQLFKRSGFYPLSAQYHTYLWERMATAIGLGRWQHGLSALLRTVLPVHVFSSTLRILARKVKVM